MSFGSNTHRTTWIALGLALMVPLSVIAATDDAQLLTAKDEFNQLWHAAAATTKKRATLEQVLAQFDGKVASARKDLEKASQQRKVIREHITEHRAFVEALQGQLQATEETKAFYDSVALGQRDDFIRFLRYMTSKNIALHESGPAAGGPLLKQVIRGSLGDSIDDALAFDAVLKARTQFLGQVRVLVSESDKVQERLKEVANDYAAELQLLENEHRSIATIVDEKSQFIDNSWKEKKLTEEELQYVAQEASEANARIALMQTSLVQINEELKKSKLKKLEDTTGPLKVEMKTLEEQRDTITRKDTAMQLLETAAEKAFQAATAAKDSDKKLYQKIELKKLTRGNLVSELATLESQQAASGSELTVAKIVRTKADIAFIDATLTYMKDGVPADLAEAYIRAKLRADEATIERKKLAAEIATFDPKIAELQKQIVAKTEEAEKAAKQYELGGDLPPIFLWPVSGPITAGYFDLSYEAVFGVPHRAVDIAVPQATPVRSVSDGVVFAFKDGGLTGYSYILIGHRNGYASLYGHVSSSFVKQGDIVSAGQMVGLSGGRPGTRGAGYMTTGAHLHLEITKDGVHVNPTSILPPR